MVILVDRRIGKQSKQIANKELFKKYHAKQIREAIGTIIAGRDFESISGKEWKLPIKGVESDIIIDTEEKSFKKIFIRNEKYKRGDKIEKKLVNSNGGSKDGEGEDEFLFSMSDEEIRKFLFTNLALPPFRNTKEKAIVSKKRQYVGVTKSGIPSKLDIVRSIKNSIGRNLALAAAYDEEISSLEHDVENKFYMDLRDKIIDEQKICSLENEKECLLYIDDIDLRYRHYEDKPITTAKAVIFFIMDVSGSMDEEQKGIAKLFFYLTYFFVSQFYDSVEIVPIRHTQTARVSSIDDFFNRTDTGGTVLSSGLKIVSDMIEDVYSRDNYNLYLVQASDSENESSDDEVFLSLVRQLQPVLDLFVYLHVSREPVPVFLTELATNYSRYVTWEWLYSIHEVFHTFSRIFKK